MRNGEKVVMWEYGAVVRTEGSELESGYGSGEEEAEPLGGGVLERTGQLEMEQVGAE